MSEKEDRKRSEKGRKRSEGEARTGLLFPIAEQNKQLGIINIK